MQGEYMWIVGVLLAAGASLISNLGVALQVRVDDFARVCRHYLLACSMTTKFSSICQQYTHIDSS